MPKWPMLVVTLLACSGETELDTPMLGDCPHCTTAPSPGGGISSSSDASLDVDDGDVADFDASVPD